MFDEAYGMKDTVLLLKWGSDCVIKIRGFWHCDVVVKQKHKNIKGYLIPQFRYNGYRM